MFIEKIKQEIEAQLKELTGVETRLEVKPGFGDFSSSIALRLAKKLKRNPQEVAEELAEKINAKGVEVKAENGFLNFFLTEEALLFNLEHLFDFDAENKTIVIDYSSPNIAKPFSVGHLRSTIIGDSLRRIFELFGNRVVSINFLGDWGKQFGKLLAAYKLWPVELEPEPIKKLLQLYVRFHKEAEVKPELEELAEEWFRRLESGDNEALELWRKFRELSLKEFEKIYRLLGISLEQFVDAGESKFVEPAKRLVEELLSKGIAKVDEGAVVIPLEEFGLTPLLIRKKDGTTIYAARDLASALWRIEQFKPDALLYVVGAEQGDYFKKLFAALRKLGVKAELEHIAFGLVRLPSGKMSTRKGRVIFLEDVLKEAIERVKKILKERGVENDEIARKVGVGAVKFFDLKNNRLRGYVFSWEMLNFEGETGPYVQYACVRAKRILEKFGKGKPGIGNRELARALVRLRLAVVEAKEKRRPDYIANALLEIARMFNEIYEKERFGGRASMEYLASKIAEALEKGLYLLGIEVPEAM